MIRLQSRQQTTPFLMTVFACSGASRSIKSADFYSAMFESLALRVGGVLLTGMGVYE